MTNPVPVDTVWPADICVVRYALERHAQEKPDEVFAVFEDDSEWTYQELFSRVRRMALGLQKTGVRQGDRVMVMLPNGKAAVQALFSINYLGAVAVPINTAYKGALLQHVISDSGTRVAIVHESLAERFTEVVPDRLETLILTSTSRGTGHLSGLFQITDLDELTTEDGAPEPLERDIVPWDLQHIIYTSGTTGRSKGVLSSYMHSFSACNPDTWHPIRPDDRHLLHMPVFHIGGAFICSMALCVGASVAVINGFKTDSFWQTIRDKKVTAAFLLGAMATFLLKQPKVADEKNHPLRVVFLVPLGHSGPAFADRFGVDFYSLFNMTEISTPLITGKNPAKPNVCGRPRPGVEVRLVDSNDCPVPPGSAGELIIRTSAPWAMNHGYNNNPEATAEAWRNGWFHTGDVFMQDADGDFIFVDRLKDTIRRRGENISSYELEIELLSHPDIREAAAIGVPSEYSEDEVLAVLSPVPGRQLIPEEVIEFLVPRLPYFMLPRYIQVIDELPKTPTEKIQKNLLRDAGVTSDTWDRDAAGIKIRRDNIKDI